MLFVISKNTINEDRIQKIKYFLFKYERLNLIKINILNNKKNEFTIWLNGVKKFNSRAKNDKTIKPKISCKE